MASSLLARNVVRSVNCPLRVPDPFLCLPAPLIQARSLPTLRALSTSSVLRKGDSRNILLSERTDGETTILADFVQELYLKELKNYKAPPAVGFFIHFHSIHPSEMSP